MPSQMGVHSAPLYQGGFLAFWLNRHQNGGRNPASSLASSTAFIVMLLGSASFRCCMRNTLLHSTGMISVDSNPPCPSGRGGLTTFQSLSHPKLLSRGSWCQLLWSLRTFQNFPFSLIFPKPAILLPWYFCQEAGSSSLWIWPLSCFRGGLSFLIVIMLTEMLQLFPAWVLGQILLSWVSWTSSCFLHRWMLSEIASLSLFISAKEVRITSLSYLGKEVRITQFLGHLITPLCVGLYGPRVVLVVGSNLYLLFTPPCHSGFCSKITSTGQPSLVAPWSPAISSHSVNILHYHHHLTWSYPPLASAIRHEHHCLETSFILFILGPGS